MAIRLTNGYLNMGAPAVGNGKYWCISLFAKFLTYPEVTSPLVDKWAYSEARSFQITISPTGRLRFAGFFNANFQTLTGDCYTREYVNQVTGEGGFRDVPLNEWVQIWMSWQGSLRRVGCDEGHAVGGWGYVMGDDGNVVSMMICEPYYKGEPGMEHCDGLSAPSLTGVSAGTPDGTSIGIGRGSRDEWMQDNQRLNCCLAHFAYWSKGVDDPGGFTQVAPKSMLTEEDGFIVPTSVRPEYLRAYFPMESDLVATYFDPALNQAARIGTGSNVSICEDAPPLMPPDHFPKYVRGTRSMVYPGNRGSGLKGVKKRGHRDLLVEPSGRDAKAKRG